MSEVQEKCRRAKEASRIAGVSSTQEKNDLLRKMISSLDENRREILESNGKDIEAGVSSGMRGGLLDRLRLDEKRIDGMLEALLMITNLPDPSGEIIHGWTRPNGLRIMKRRVPIGVIGIIYEARPNVTVEASGLALKAGNAVILRGSSSALATNRSIVSALRKAAGETKLPEDVVQLIESPDREAVNELMKMDRYVDLLIPRGGAGLIRSVVENSTIPVIETGVGNCHVYVDAEADLAAAEEIAFNAKVQRPSVCNAAETLLVHEKIAPEFLPKIFRRYREAGVVIRGDEYSRRTDPAIEAATDEDYAEEFLDLIIAVRVVKSLDEAVEHIHRFGTRHTEAIVTRDITASRKFADRVDAAAVMINASTRFTDGGEFGFGAEMGISTQKLHARGPIGLPELTTVKYVVEGEGHIRT